MLLSASEFRGFIVRSFDQQSSTHRYALSAGSFTYTLHAPLIFDDLSLAWNFVATSGIKLSKNDGVYALFHVPASFGLIAYLLDLRRGAIVDSHLIQTCSYICPTGVTEETQVVNHPGQQIS